MSLTRERTDGLVRCDGCGEEVTGAKKHYDDSDSLIATLCVGCQDLRHIRGDDVEDIEQYQYVGGDE